MITLSLFLIKGLIILSAAALVQFLLRRQSTVLRDRIWTITFAALLAVTLAPLLPSVTVPVPRIEAGPDMVNPVTGPAREPVSGRANAPIEPPPIATRPVSRPDTAVTTTAFDKKAIPALVVLIWATGAFALLARIAMEIASLTAAWSGARIAPVAMQRIHRKCARRIGLRTLPGLRASEGVRVPMALGGWRPSSVLLPGEAVTWSAERLESVLLHELGHLRRNDPAIALLSAIACALHWVNPLAWWAMRRGVVEREKACDLKVLATGTNRFNYAQHLVDAARDIAVPGRASPLFPASVPHMASVSCLRQRVSALLGNAPVVAELGRAKSWVTLIFAAAALVPIACARVTGQSQEVGAGTAAAQLLDTSLGAQHRLHAAWQLGEREDGDAVGALLTTLEDEDPALRGMSAWALGEIKDASALPYLIAAIEDDDSKAREMAIRAIGEIDDPRVVDPLIAAARFADDEHRAAAVRALGDLDWSADAREALEAALADSSTVVRKAAVFAFAESGHYAGATDVLIPLLNDDDANVRALAAESLGVVGSPAAIDALIVASRDNDPEVRAWAVWALDEIDVENR